MSFVWKSCADKPVLSVKSGSPTLASHDDFCMVSSCADLTKLVCDKTCKMTKIIYLTLSSSKCNYWLSLYFFLIPSAGLNCKSSGSIFDEIFAQLVLGTRKNYFNSDNDPDIDHGF